MDQTSTYPVVCFGEILWDILPGGMAAGGAPMNVTYHLRKNGINSALITKIGHDEDGKKLVQLMERNDISTDYFQMDFELSTGRVYAIIGANHDMTYDIRKPVAWDNINWEDDFATLLSRADYFVFGSLACRSENSRDTLFRLLEAARYKVLDINLRPPHFSRQITENLLAAAGLLKLNLSELELITGWFSNYRNTTDRIRILQDRFRIPCIVVTKGSGGSVMSVNGELYEHPGFSIEVVDTIGSGDAFLAGLILKLSQGANPAAALDFSSALGALVAGYAGPCPEYDVMEISQVMKAGISH